MNILMLTAALFHLGRRAIDCACVALQLSQHYSPHMNRVATIILPIQKKKTVKKNS